MEVLAHVDALASADAAPHIVFAYKVAPGVRDTVNRDDVGGLEMLEDEEEDVVTEGGDGVCGILHVGDGGEVTRR